MRKRESIQKWAFVLAIVSLVCVIPSLVMAETVEVTGIVYAAAWDDNDNVTAVVIEVDNGENMLVTNSGKGGELLKLDDGTQVKANGSISITEDGIRSITVSKYSILE